MLAERQRLWEWYWNGNVYYSLIPIVITTIIIDCELGRRAKNPYRYAGSYVRRMWYKKINLILHIDIINIEEGEEEEEEDEKNALWYPIDWYLQDIVPFGSPKEAGVFKSNKDVGRGDVASTRPQPDKNLVIITIIIIKRSTMIIKHNYNYNCDHCNDRWINAYGRRAYLLIIYELKETKKKINEKKQPHD